MRAVLARIVRGGARSRAPIRARVPARVAVASRDGAGRKQPPLIGIRRSDAVVEVRGSARPRVLHAPSGGSIAVADAVDPPDRAAELPHAVRDVTAVVGDARFRAQISRAWRAVGTEDKALLVPLPGRGSLKLDALEPDIVLEHPTAFDRG